VGSSGPISFVRSPSYCAARKAEFALLAAIEGRDRPSQVRAVIVPWHDELVGGVAGGPVGAAKSSACASKIWPGCLRDAAARANGRCCWFRNSAHRKCGDRSITSSVCGSGHATGIPTTAPTDTTRKGAVCPAWRKRCIRGDPDTRGGDHVHNPGSVPAANAAASGMRASVHPGWFGSACAVTRVAPRLPPRCGFWRARGRCWARSRIWRLRPLRGRTGRVTQRSAATSVNVAHASSSARVRSTPRRSVRWCVPHRHQRIQSHPVTVGVTATAAGRHSHDRSDPNTKRSIMSAALGG